MANGENPQIVRAMLRWTNLNMLAHYALMRMASSQTSSKLKALC
jgi:hypothetical protein